MSLFKYRLSTINVAKGSKEANRTMPRLTKFHRKDLASSIANKIYPMNKTPCAIPMGYKRDL